MILSHAHLDHSGLIPKLIADGYSGQIYMTNPSNELLEILHKDAATLQERDIEWENKRRRRSGKKEIEPLYTTNDVEIALTHYKGIPYGHRQQVTNNIEVCFRDAGHILGSAIVELFITDTRMYLIWKTEILCNKVIQVVCRHFYPVYDIHAQLKNQWP